MGRAASRRATSWRGLLLVVLIAGTSACANHVVVPQWEPKAFRDLDTLEFLTVGPQEGPHWSTVWLVVLDDAVYIRLGARAADRMRQNADNPHVSVRIGGREYEHVSADEAPAMAERVSAAMYEKYTTDLFVRHFSHPLTMRLQPDPAAGEH